MSLADDSVVVIGSGVGGLSTACYLADAGATVTVLERNEQLGGRASRLYRDGFRFDMGPSWYLMPDVFERFFATFGREPSDYYELKRLDPHYSMLFKDGDRVDIPADREATKELFESYESGAGDALDAYLEEATHTYEVGMEHFVYEDRSRWRDWLDPSIARHARGLSFLGSMQEHVEQYFDHPKLQQIMQYTLVFLGGSPQNTPALYNLMSHVDFNLGVWYPEGGIGAVIDGLVELGSELGVEYRTDCAVTAIKGRHGGFLLETEAGTAADTGFDTGIDAAEPADRSSHATTTTPTVEDEHESSAVARDGGTAVADDSPVTIERGPGSTDGITADLVVSDADMAHVEQELLPPEKVDHGEEYWESRTYAPSAFLLYLGVEGDVPALEHHTLVLPTDWEPHFEQIFEDPAWPEDPAYYLCVPSKTDDTVAPEGHSNLFALVPIAAGLEDDPETRSWYRDHVLDDIAEHTGENLRDRIVVEEQFCVSDFASRYNSMRGTALGMAHTLRQTAMFRPTHRSGTVDGLYFTGSYTTPGIGVPMCLISGEIAADKLIADHG
jgi:phytoene desaturase